MDMYAKLKEILSEKIDVLILECDEMMIPLQRYLKEYHISVPQNMSVISIRPLQLQKWHLLSLLHYALIMMLMLQVS